MNNIRDWTPTEDDCLMTIEEWEGCVADGLFIDYDGFGYFINVNDKTELYGFNVYPSMIGEPAYEQRKIGYTHVNWFNR